MFKISLGDGNYLPTGETAEHEKVNKMRTLKFAAGPPVYIVRAFRRKSTSSGNKQLEQTWLL